MDSKHDNTDRMILDTIRDAAIQRRFIEHREQDSKLSKNGWKIFYAADADICDLYAKPEGNTKSEESPTSGGEANSRKSQPVTGIPYSRVFVDDEPESASAIANALTKYIFFTLSPIPIMLIPPIDSEVGGYIKSLSSRIYDKSGCLEPPRRPAEKEKEKDYFTELKKYFSRIDDYNLQFVKISQLIGKKRIFPANEKFYEKAMEALSSQQPENSPNRNENDGRCEASYSESHLKALARAIEAINDESRTHEKEVFKARWLDAIDSIKKEVLDARDSRDAEALSTVLALNVFLQEYKIRVLYITGTARLFRAERCFDFSIAAIDDKCKDEGYEPSFLRHPRSFLEDELLMAGIDNKRLSGKFSTMFDALLGKSLKPKDILNGHELRDEKAMLGIHREDYRAATVDVRSGWTKFKEDFVQLFPDVTADDIEWFEKFIKNKDEIQNLEKWEEEIDSLRKDQVAKFAAAWESMFDSAAEFGTYFMLAPPSKGSETSRHPFSPPLLWINRFHQARENLSELRDLQRIGDNRTDTIKYLRYKEMLESAKGEGCLKYLYYLTHAALYASQGEWALSIIFSDSALAMTKKDGASQERINGREANYLRSLSMRCLAKDKTQDSIRSAVPFLREAIRIAEYEIEKEKDADPAYDIIPERFCLEGIINDISVLLCGAIGNVPQDKWSDIIIKAQTLEKDLADGVKKNASRTASNVRDEIEKMRYRIYCRLYINIVLVKMLQTSDFSKLHCDASFVEYVKKLEAKMNFFAGKDTQVINEFGLALLPLAQALAETGENSFSQVAELKNKFAGNGAKKISSFPFDKRLCDYIAHRIDEYLKSHME